jgi:hypothetical protein
MSLDFFSTFSYFENKTDIGYLSLYPSGPGKCKYTGQIPTNGESVFQIQTNDIYRQLNLFLNELKKNNFGFSDFFFLASQSDSYTASELIEWYKSLYYHNGIQENGICKIQIKSLLDSSFQKTCYLKDTPLPQEALDTFVFFCNQKGNIYTALGTKRKAPLVTVSFVADQISLLKVGMFGTVILGEHLEPAEKKEMNDAFVSFQENQKNTGKNVMKIETRQMKPSMRALAEEFGFTSGQFDFDTYIIGKDARDGRDPRYWTFGNQNQYGYKRQSESLMVALISHCDIPTEIPEPQDIDECSKGVIVSVDYALREFSETGNLQCAFPSHPVQFRMCVNELPNMI